ncbi:hypothetical protein B0920_02680 [Massilia sp. KIM]|uniref:NADPH:quinone reductase n=1 Tax=Massilia sp. KIM TaxID=1955422 RepID=UPI0009C6F430|nr:NADPH:quinone reductase [Massilia sp. KIM]OON62390.1 hypothetical protein B0920_02680 [Massilia sp. KIM]
MKAVVYRALGPAAEVLGLEELEVPEPGAQELRIRVAYSGVNPSDTKARAGISQSAMAWPWVVPHSDGSGVVERVGAGLDPSWLGKRVWFFNAQWRRQHGSAAEYLCLPPSQVAELPDGVALELGAAIGIPLLTAWHAVHAYGELRDRTVLVTGGAGNVALHAIQLARRAGARVIATASSEAKRSQAREAGAALALDYRDMDALAAALRAATDGAGADLIIDVDASWYAPHYPALLAFGGRAVVYGSRAPDFRLDYRGMMRIFGSVSHFIVYLLPPAQLARAVEGVNALLRAGGQRFGPVLRFAPEDAAAAHRFVEEGKVGKAVLAFAGGD